MPRAGTRMAAGAYWGGADRPRAGPASAASMMARWWSGSAHAPWTAKPRRPSP